MLRLMTQKIPTPLKRRAVKDAAKTQKRDRIIEIAGVLLAKRDFDDVSMDEVARVAGIAKGTLYLYFKTKEELFLAVYIEDFKEWYVALNDFLETSKKISAEKFAAWFADKVTAMPRFLKLCVGVPIVFQRNIPRDVAVNFKRLATSHLKSTAPLLAERLGFKTEAHARRFLILLIGLIVGLWSLGYASPMILEIKSEEKMNDLPSNFGELLRQTTKQLLVGMLTD